jgi:hypothetical protein
VGSFGRNRCRSSFCQNAAGFVRAKIEGVPRSSAARLAVAGIEFIVFSPNGFVLP